MVRTFGIVGCMLIISTITARLNKTYETFTEKFITILGAFASIIMVWVFGDIYPHNIVACAFLSGFVGWSLGPTIGYIGQKFKWNKFLKDKGVKTKQISNKSGFWGLINNTSVDSDPYNQVWQNVVFQAMLSTCIAVFTTMLVVYISPYNFNFLGLILFISLIALIIMRVLNALIFKSAKQMLYQSYFGIVIFTLYLVYDFDRLKQANAAGDNSWGTAVDIAVNIYLDIINLFIELLIAMGEHSQ